MYNSSCCPPSHAYFLMSLKLHNLVKDCKQCCGANIFPNYTYEFFKRNTLKEGGARRAEKYVE